MLFGYINLNIINAKATYKNSYDLLLIFNLDFALSLFMCISYGRQFSGGIYNPAIVLYRMLRKTDRLTIKIGITYQISQFGGALVGCLIGTFYDK
jgi:glycerol uptake facilitator-like aquaporin